MLPLDSPMPRGVGCVLASSRTKQAVIADDGIADSHAVRTGASVALQSHGPPIPWRLLSTQHPLVISSPRLLMLRLWFRVPTVWQPQMCVKVRAPKPRVPPRLQAPTMREIKFDYETTTNRRKR